MSSWSSRRKFMYGSIIIIGLILLIGVPTFFISYKAPTCFDNKQNSNETGVDCGGSCTKLCQNSFISPRIVWGGAKFEKVANGLYNLASLIENKNINGSAKNVPYMFSVFDDKGILIVEKKGSITLNAHRNSLAFEPAINVGKRTPFKATFEFLEAPSWFLSKNNLDGLIVFDKKYNEDELSSRLEVIIKNDTLFPYKNLIVSAILKDIGGNVIGFSRTIIDSINENGARESAFFTWPISRENKVSSIEVFLNIPQS